MHFIFVNYFSLLYLSFIVTCNFYMPTVLTDTVYKPSVGINTKGDMGTLLIPQKEEHEITAYYFILEDNSGKKFRVEVSKKIWNAHENKEIFSVLKKKNFFDEIVYTHNDVKISLKEVGK